MVAEGGAAARLGFGASADEIVKCADPAATALTVAEPVKSARAARAKVPLVAPAGSVIALGRDSRALLLLIATRVEPSAGMGAFMVTVQSAVPSAASRAGAQLMDDGGGQPTLTTALCATPPQDAVRVTWRKGAAAASAAKVTEAAPAGMEMLEGAERLVALLLAMATVRAAGAA